MTLELIEHDLTVCKVNSADSIDLGKDFYFASKTDEEISLVCITDDCPPDTTEREDGWKAFRITGVLDFSLIGILAPIAALLADNSIGIFVVSTYNTDYILVKKESLDKALCLLENEGYTILR